MPRLIVLSNRTVDPSEPISGGLAVALWSTLRQSGGLWFGWNGKIAEETGQSPLQISIKNVDNISMVTMPLTRNEYENYYTGYANNVLWPVFHSRVDIALFSPKYRNVYNQVNEKFARAIFPLINHEDIVWVHDYQLIPCGYELRKLGLRNKIGFFLHIPFPPAITIRTIPDQCELISSLLSYDLIGFQSKNDLSHFVNYIVAEFDATQTGSNLYLVSGKVVEIGVFPIGIDVTEISDSLKTDVCLKMIESCKQNFAGNFVLGVDRLDYIKGLPQRIHAIRNLLVRYPENRRQTTLLQIASPSRENVEAYDSLRKLMDSLSGELNGDFGDHNWSPVQYIHRNISRRELPGIYRASRVGLVTPLCDGMNLVAKEYIVAQDPADPGTLVLSIFTGAANQLTEAILVNPYDIDAVSEAIQIALNMPLEERKRRHSALLAKITSQDVHWWCAHFLSALCEDRDLLVV